jgi:carbamoyl-phosphate synthase large subunit
LTLFQKGKVDLAINITDAHFRRDIDDDYVIRRAAIDHNINLITNRHKAELFVKALVEKSLDNLEIKSWNEY